MEAYHIKTNERSPYDAIGLETFVLNSLYIPEKGILIGFVRNDDKEGAILSYHPYPSIYAKRMWALVNEKEEFEGIPIKGGIINKIDLDNKIINKIKRNYKILLIRRDYHYHKIKLDKEFSGSTDHLIKILSGEFKRRKPIWKRWL